jgi:hypothetical protein
MESILYPMDIEQSVPDLYLNQKHRVRRRRIAVIAGAAAVLMVALAHLGALPPVAGQSGPEATVTATLQIASSCLVVSPTAVDFGTLEFTQPASARSTAAPTEATASVSLRNCSSQSQSVLVRGGPAIGSGVLWGHAPPGADVCIAPNLFIQGVRDASGTAKRLTIFDQAFKSLQAGTTEPITLTLIPPCSGSTGTGHQMTVKYTFIATFTEQGSR